MSKCLILPTGMDLIVSISSKSILSIRSSYTVYGGLFKTFLFIHSWLNGFIYGTVKYKVLYSAFSGFKSNSKYTCSRSFVVKPLMHIVSPRKNTSKFRTSSSCSFIPLRNIHSKRSAVMGIETALSTVTLLNVPFNFFKNSFTISPALHHTNF